MLKYSKINTRSRNLSTLNLLNLILFFRLFWIAIFFKATVILFQNQTTHFRLLFKKSMKESHEIFINHLKKLKYVNTRAC